MLSIIIPTLNEEEGIAKVICSIPEEIRNQSEVIVVDVSNDLTPLIAERLGAKVIRAEKKGKGRQMRQGVENSQGEVLIFLDGDGTDPPQYIPKLLKELEGADLVLGCRSLKNFKEDDKTMREILNFYAFFVKRLFYLIGFKIGGDPLAGFRAIRREDWDKLDLKSNEFEIEAEMNIKATEKGFKIKAVAIPHFKRGGGLLKSKLIANPKMWFRILNTVLKYLHNDRLKPKIKILGTKLRSKI